MSNHKIAQVCEVFSDNDANKYLDIGWVIVTVVSGNRNPPEQETDIGPVYVMGWTGGQERGNDEPARPILDDD